MIANAISTDKINVSAVATNGAVANVNGIVGGSMESGFSQADVNAWAYTGTGIYEGKPKIEELRVIANLFPDCLAKVCLYWQFMCTVTQSHKRALERMTIDFAPDLNQTTSPKERNRFRPDHIGPAAFLCALL